VAAATVFLDVEVIFAKYLDYNAANDSS